MVLLAGHKRLVKIYSINIFSNIWQGCASNNSLMINVWHVMFHDVTFFLAPWQAARSSILPVASQSHYIPHGRLLLDHYQHQWACHTVGHLYLVCIHIQANSAIWLAGSTGTITVHCSDIVFSFGYYAWPASPSQLYSELLGWLYLTRLTITAVRFFFF